MHGRIGVVENLAAGWGGKQFAKIILVQHAVQHCVAHHSEPVLFML